MTCALWIPADPNRPTSAQVWVWWQGTWRTSCKEGGVLTQESPLPPAEAFYCSALDVYISTEQAPGSNFYMNMEAMKKLSILLFTECSLWRKKANIKERSPPTNTSQPGMAECFHINERTRRDRLELGYPGMGAWSIHGPRQWLRGGDGAPSLPGCVRECVKPLPFGNETISSDTYHLLCIPKGLKECLSSINSYVRKKWLSRDGHYFQMTRWPILGHLTTFYSSSVMSLWSSALCSGLRFNTNDFTTGVVSHSLIIWYWNAVLLLRSPSNILQQNKN